MGKKWTKKYVEYDFEESRKSYRRTVNAMINLKNYEIVNGRLISLIILKEEEEEKKLKEKTKKILIQ